MIASGRETQLQPIYVSSLIFPYNIQYLHVSSVESKPSWYFIVPPVLHMPPERRLPLLLHCKRNLK